MRFGVTFVIGLLLAGCETSPEQEQANVCTVFCGCAAGPLQSQVDSCIVDDCMPDIPPVTDACLQCVDASSQQCGELFDDCLDLCFNVITPRFGGTR